MYKNREHFLNPAKVGWIFQILGKCYTTNLVNLLKPRLVIFVCISRSITP